MPDPATRRERMLPFRLLSGLWIAPLWAIPFAVFFGVIFGGTKQAFVLSYKASLVFSFVIGYANLLLSALGSRWRPRLVRVSERAPWLGEILLRFAGNVVASYTAAYLIHRYVVPGFLGTPRDWLVSGMYTLLFFTLVSGITMARIFHGEAVERAAAVERVRAELARAEARALRAQINPHFLFNTLNTIAALIAQDPRAAEDVVTRLADVFRYALTSAGHERSRFGDELEFVRAYLAIEKARFGDRLRVEEDIAPGLEAVRVPSLLLQPLVENAVHHAIAPRPTGGTVTLRALAHGDRLVVTLADDGPGLAEGVGPRGHGVGLESVRERMRLAGPDHRFELDGAPGRGVQVRLEFPLVTPHLPEVPPCEPDSPSSSLC